MRTPSQARLHVCAPCCWTKHSGVKPCTSAALTQDRRSSGGRLATRASSTAALPARAAAWTAVLTQAAFHVTRAETRKVSSLLNCKSLKVKKVCRWQIAASCCCSQQLKGQLEEATLIHGRAQGSATTGHAPVILSSSVMVKKQTAGLPGANDTLVTPHPPAKLAVLGTAV